MPSYQITSQRGRKGTPKVMGDPIEARTQSAALRTYGCNVASGQRVYKTKRGNIIKASPVA
jgi:hypothetical protein